MTGNNGSQPEIACLIYHKREWDPGNHFLLFYKPWNNFF